MPKSATRHAKSVSLQGEYNAKYDKLTIAMARRPNSPSQEQLTAAELAELRCKLEIMPRHELEIFYKATHNACALRVRLPSPRLIQELVQAWKTLRARGHRETVNGRWPVA